MTATDTAPFTVRRAEETPAASLPPFGQFIGGTFIPSSSASMVDVVNPATEEILMQVPAGSEEDVDAAVAAAVAAKTDWAAKTPQDWSAVLLRIADIIEANRELLETLEAANTGKPAAVAEDDISSAIDTFRFSAGAARAFTTPGAGDYAQNHTSVILREPVGVVGVITPWNYPLLMAAWKIAPILAAGNTMVLKPSEQTPLTTLKLAELIAAEVPGGVLNIVTGSGRVVGNRISEHPDVDLVAITGSVGSGQKVAASASSTVKRVHLELGGKAPVVVFEDADLEAAAKGVRSAGFWNGGQECGAACRVLVHKSVAAKFTELLVREVSEISVGTPGAGDEVEMGSMISKAHYDRVLAALQDIRNDGLTIAVGGNAIEGRGYFIEPTVVSNVPAGAAITSTEIFGPVVSVETFSTDEEAVARANETIYGLAASVWTTNAARSLSVPRSLDFGTVWVNSHLVIANEMPWGGFKGSGYGRDLSIYALEDFSRTKHVMYNHG
ncbi:aldehyde dehydrogenase family protein [Arthrobacter sp. AZCC_0090]|uniref:aldehyde dehydrogenase family protein n=1 Tax=Arthrobacter sp. AZCC_0090 TaxID=2735881 RepID=UPI00160CAAA6|nr:aldehyde dehydrogenase family protein [Arthrobacter sp. AZCC_0090]MBB6405114.1 aldehyde dehydrogenase (NAD+)/aminobutyraldehyde dehydrogenase [Arthrobacter sp. AZCC_0090]